MKHKERLDVLVHQRGLAESVVRAQALILAGQVVLECQVPDDLDIVAEALAIQLTGAPDATAAQQVGPPQGIECSQWAELVRMCGSPARAIETLRRNGYPTEEP